MGIESSIFNGIVSHSRLLPKVHNFSYKVYSMLFNIDELEKTQKECKFFSYNKFNLFSFYYKDHGEKDGSNPKEWILKIAKKESISPLGLKIFCLCYPRVLGYVFNPISVWFIYNKNTLRMIIYEVRNTFGEDHSYVFNLINESEKLNHKSKKLLHVSPFINMDGRYEFSTDLSSDQVKVIIKEISNNKHLLTASFIGKAKSFNDKNLFLNFILYPMLTFKVIFGIHYQALILWLKNIKYVKHRKSKYNKISYKNEYTLRDDESDI